MTQQDGYGEDRPSTESIAAMGSGSSTPETQPMQTLDDRPAIQEDDRPVVRDDDRPVVQEDDRPDVHDDTRDVQDDTPAVGSPDASDVRLVPEEHAHRMREQWGEVQAMFVDDPRGAVTHADAMVAELMQTLAAGFADHKRGLEEKWQRGEQAGTEDLRVALQHYRAFMDRLLHT
jgi:hypothetical protein